jgi:hypothetical protein
MQEPSMIRPLAMVDLQSVFYILGICLLLALILLIIEIFIHRNPKARAMVQKYIE